MRVEQVRPAIQFLLLLILICLVGGRPAIEALPMQLLWAVGLGFGAVILWSILKIAWELLLEAFGWFLRRINPTLGNRVSSEY